MKLSNGRVDGVVREIIEVIRINEDKNIKWKYKLKDKLIILTYHLKLLFTLSYIIKSFYQTYLIYLIT